jgi:phosphotriesterase-related protein
VAEGDHRKVETVLGPVDDDQLGVVLVHEHVMVDWIGAELTTPARYNPHEIVEAALPYLEQARDLGVQTLLDCTPAFLGRDVSVLQLLAQKTGLHILTNTGLYGAMDDRFVPAYAFETSAESLAEAWIQEWEQGIDGTGIRPAFMKIGVDPGPLSPIDRKLVEAAAITHRATGLNIHSHTTEAEAGRSQLELLEALDVPLEAFVWVHAHNIDDLETLADAATRGAWIELDGVAPDTVDHHAELVVELNAQGHLDRLLLSHDAGCYQVGEPGGAPESFRGYNTISTTLLPELINRGMKDHEMRKLLVDNPRRLLAAGNESIAPGG